MSDVDSCCLGCLLLPVLFCVFLVFLSFPSVCLIGLFILAFWHFASSDTFKETRSNVANGVDAFFNAMVNCGRVLFAYVPGAVTFFETRRRKKESTLVKGLQEEISIVEAEQRQKQTESKQEVISRLKLEAAISRGKNEHDLEILADATREMAGVIAKIKRKRIKVVLVSCQVCKKKFSLKPKYRGKKVHCPNKLCAEVIRVPKNQPPN